MKEEKKPNNTMKNAPPNRPAIVHTEHKLPSPLINSMEDLHIFSAAVFKSQMWAGIKNPDTAMVRIQAGRELGLQPIMALNKIHVLPKGDIVISTQVMGAIAMDQGVRWQILQKDTKGCKLRIYKLDGSIPEHTESFTMEDAKRADLDWKPNYKKNPEEMCYNRCLSKGLKVFDPRIGAGFYTREEMEDVEKFGAEPDPNATPLVHSKIYMKEKEEIQDAEIVEEEEDIEEAVDEAMEEEQQPQQRVKKPEPTPPEVDDAPELTAELKQKEANINIIKERAEILKLDISDFKLHLSEVQKTRVFVGENQWGHWSFHLGTTEALIFLVANSQEFFRKYVERRFKTMQPGERIGCFVKPESTND